MAILALSSPRSIALATASKLLPLPDAIMPRTSGGRALLQVTGVGEIRLDILSVMDVRKMEERAKCPSLL
jgi:hypothetical protein